jgi:hypothetical protein
VNLGNVESTNMGRFREQSWGEGMKKWSWETKFFVSFFILKMGAAGSCEMLAVYY